MSIQPITLVVIAANVLGGAMALPQAAKIFSDRRTQGISPMWVGISAALNAWWGVYAWGVGDWGILPVSIVSVLAYSVIGRSLVHYRPARRRDVLVPMVGAAAAAGAVPALSVAVGGWVTAGIVLGAMYGVQLSPAVVTVYRAHDVSGVSVSTWVIGLVEAGLWGVYGLVHLDSGLMALAVTGTVMSSLVLVRLLLRRPRRTPYAIAPTLAAA